MPVKEIEEKQEPGQQGQDQKDPGQASEKQADIDLSRIERKGQFQTRGKPGKVFVMASADMLKNNVVDAAGRGANSILIINIIDYLNGREGIAVMRGKEQRFNPLEDTEAGVKTFVKALNIAGLAVLVIIFGMGVWFRRHSRKKHIQMMFA